MYEVQILRKKDRGIISVRIPDGDSNGAWLTKRTMGYANILLNTQTCGSVQAQGTRRNDVGFSESVYGRSAINYLMLASDTATKFNAVVRILYKVVKRVINWIIMSYYAIFSISLSGTLV